MATTRTLALTRLHGSVRVTIGEGAYSERTADTDNNRFGDWEHFSYRVTLTFQGRVMWFMYHQNIAHPVDQVNPRDALESLVIDFRAYENNPNFFDFCEEFGYEPTDANSARIYQALRRSFESVERVFRSHTDSFLAAFKEA